MAAKTIDAAIINAFWIITGCPGCLKLSPSRTFPGWPLTSNCYLRPGKKPGPVYRGMDGGLLEAAVSDSFSLVVTLLILVSSVWYFKVDLAGRSIHLFHPLSQGCLEQLLQVVRQVMAPSFKTTAIDAREAS